MTTILGSLASSSSGGSRSAYANADSDWIKVQTWEEDLFNTAASSGVTVEWIKYKKVATGVKHEYLLFKVGDDDIFVTERNNRDPPDYTMTNAKEANRHLATLTLSAENTLPQRTFARILTVVSAKAPNYGWRTNNCYWYAGSVWETVRLGLAGAVVAKDDDDWKDRGQFQFGWSMTVGTGPVAVPVPTDTPPAGVSVSLPYEAVIKEFGTPENLEAYRKVHIKNIGPLQEDFKNDLEKQTTIALRGLVGFILFDLAGTLKDGEEFEDLPALQGWLKEDRLPPTTGS